MGALSRPGPQLGALGPPPPGFPPEAREQGYARWLFQFITDELRPYPGRWAIMSRMIVSATLTMILIMTFRLPGAAIAGYYTLLLARQSPVETLRGAATVIAGYLLAGAYCMLGIWLFVDYPLTHFLWVVTSLFLCFFVIKVVTNYVAAAAFAFMITIVLPLWDTPAPIGVLVIGTLWATGSVSVGLVVTVLVEYLFAAFGSSDELTSGITDRLAAASRFFRAEAGEDDGAKEEAARSVSRLAMVGVSRLRRLALSSPDATRRSTVVSLVGRLIDMAATYPQLSADASRAQSAHLRSLADRLDSLQQHLGHRNRSSPKQDEAAPPAPADHSSHDPLLTELERVTQFLEISSDERASETLPADPIPVSTPRLFVRDALTNPEHLMYALYGCLAASICYIIINAIAWRGISTALATCVITALSSVGSSRQKQVLRLAGATVGGVVFGIGAQVFILPSLDSIGGFAILFAAVTAFAAWFATASPRLSYFGLQVALAFYLINLQEFYPQTNLAIARDRVMGILLGLAMMWFVFDTLASRPAAEVMRELFATNLKLLAELAQPWKHGKPPDLKRIAALRDRVSNNFGSVNAQADAVLFEIGPNRFEHLQLRERLLAWQPRLRSLFFIENALLQYRASVNLNELAPEIFRAQMDFDDRVSKVLLQTEAIIANTHANSGNTEHSASPPRIDVHELEPAECRLRDAVDAAETPVTPRGQGVLALNRALRTILESLAEELPTQH